MLRAIITASVIFVIVTLVLYYQKSKREREKETENEIFLRCVLPSFLLGCLVFMIFYSQHFEWPVALQQFFRKRVYLDEDYFD